LESNTDNKEIIANNIMDIISKLAELIKEGKSVALCTVVESKGSTPRHQGSKMLVFPGGKTLGTVGGGEIENRITAEALDSLNIGKSRIVRYDMVDPAKGDAGVCGGQVEVYVEPYLPAPTVLIIGGGHVGKAVAHVAKWLNFRVVVSDDRAELCTPEIVPDADQFIISDMAEVTKKLEIDDQTYVILTTRGMVVDVPGLAPLLDTKAAFIGIIGSKRRWMMTRKELIAQGVPEEKLNRVHSPIGLELNAETPEEIGISIMAELIMLRNNGTGKSMKI
jgi:xanthine dehydrogenase accessory factor